MLKTRAVVRVWIAADIIALMLIAIGFASMPRTSHVGCRASAAYLFRETGGIMSAILTALGLGVLAVWEREPTVRKLLLVAWGLAFVGLVAWCWLP